MVKFNEDSFTITVETIMSPVDAWQELHDSIIECFYDADPDFFNIEDARPLLRLLKALQPDWETAKKMSK